MSRLSIYLHAFSPTKHKMKSRTLKPGDGQGREWLGEQEEKRWTG